MQTVETHPDLPVTIIYLLGRNEALPNIDFGSSQHGRLAYFAGNSIVLYTGATFGITHIISELLEEAPGTDLRNEWETVEEGSTTLLSDSALVHHPTQQSGSPADLDEAGIPVVPAPAGTYMARISSIGRDPHRNDVRLRIQLWPTTVSSSLHTLKVGDEFDPNSIMSVIPERHTPATSTAGSLALPPSDRSQLIRTDFTSNNAWTELVDRVRQPVEETPGIEFVADVQPVDDTRYDGATVQQFVDAAAASGDQPPYFVFVADAHTFTDPAMTILAIDLADNPGETVRVPPEHMWAIENNLSLGNNDFADFVNSATGGVFRNS